jgi:hypothetical protein
MGACVAKPDFGVGEAYTLLRRVGKGGEGDVWLAEDKRSGLRFALKFVPRSQEDWQVRAPLAPRGGRAQVARALGDADWRGARLVTGG